MFRLGSDLVPISCRVRICGEKGASVFNESGRLFVGEFEVHPPDIGSVLHQAEEDLGEHARSASSSAAL